MSTKACVGFFLFCLDLELFAKILKDLVSADSFFTLLLITQDLGKIKKKCHTSFCKLNVCNISAKILNSIVVGSHQSLQFFRQKT